MKNTRSNVLFRKIHHLALVHHSSVTWQLESLLIQNNFWIVNFCKSVHLWKLLDLMCSFLKYLIWHCYITCQWLDTIPMGENHLGIWLNCLSSNLMRCSCRTHVWLRSPMSLNMTHHNCVNFGQSTFFKEHLPPRITFEWLIFISCFIYEKYSI